MALPANATARLLSAAASANATLVKAGEVRLRRVNGYNAAAAGRYLKLYDSATNPPDQTMTPRKTFYLPATSPFAHELDDYFATGLSYRITTGGLDNDVGALTAGDILGLNLDYR